VAISPAQAARQEQRCGDRKILTMVTAAATTGFARAGSPGHYNALSIGIDGTKVYI
jgi:hypothetical protein